MLGTFRLGFFFKNEKKKRKKKEKKEKRKNKTIFPPRSVSGSPI
jgi:hypothetical protein